MDNKEKQGKKICMNCGSTNITTNYYLGDVYKCLNCGFIGPVIIDEDKFSEKIKKKREKKESP